jgi:hypothetical protein
VTHRQARIASRDKRPALLLEDMQYCSRAVVDPTFKGYGFT